MGNKHNNCFMVNSETKKPKFVILKDRIGLDIPPNCRVCDAPVVLYQNMECADDDYYFACYGITEDGRNCTHTFRWWMPSDYIPDKATPAAFWGDFGRRR